jgi:hypothetical protein
MSSERKVDICKSCGRTISSSESSIIVKDGIICFLCNQNLPALSHIVSENTAQEKKLKTKTKKYIVFFSIGIITTIIAQCFRIRNPSIYTLGGLIGFIVSPLIPYFVILGIISLIIAAIRRNIRKYWFPAISWLFFAAGLVDIVFCGFSEFVLEPKINRTVEELVRSGTLSELDPRERILGHWSSEDGFTHLYFGSNNDLSIINLNQLKKVKYSVEDFSAAKSWIKFNVSSEDYESHTRTIYFLGKETMLEIVELSFGKLKSELRYVGPEQSPEEKTIQGTPYLILRTIQGTPYLIPQ